MTKRWLVAGLLAFVTAVAQAAPKAADLVGTWTLVGVDNLLADGTRTQPYGEKPVGLLVFDGAGRYAIQIYRAARAPFTSGDKSKGTPDEYKATAEGGNTHFGRYTLEPDGGAIVFHIEHASFPNWEGTEQRRMLTLNGDELRYTVPVTTTGKGAVGEVTWRRAPAH